MEPDQFGAYAFSFAAEPVTCSQRSDLEMAPEVPSCLRTRSKAPATDESCCNRLFTSDVSIRKAGSLVKNMIAAAAPQASRVRGSIERLCIMFWR